MTSSRQLAFFIGVFFGGSQLLTRVHSSFGFCECYILMSEYCHFYYLVFRDIIVYRTEAMLLFLPKCQKWGIVWVSSWNGSQHLDIRLPINIEPYSYSIINGSAIPFRQSLSRRCAIEYPEVADAWHSPKLSTSLHSNGQEFLKSFVLIFILLTLWISQLTLQSTP